MFKDCLKPLQNKTIIACISGGVDSMVLLEMVNKYKDEYSITPYVCHFEHGIRGNASKADMELVKKRCSDFKIPLLLKCEDIPKIAGTKSLEQVARQRRYAFFYECLKEKNADAIVLAHHRDDNCETVLMNIIRGCGTSGLAGMENTSIIIRPLLGVSKQQLYDFAEENNIPYSEDETNKDNKYLRNSIRNELIPFLTSKNPRFCEGLERLRNIAKSENDFFNEYIKSTGGITKTEYGYDINIEIYASSHIALRRRFIYTVLKELCGADYDFGIFEDIDSLLQKQTGKRVEISKNISVYKGTNVLCFVKERHKISGEYPIKIGKTTTPFGNFTLRPLQNLESSALKNAPKNTIYLGIEAETASIYVRSRRDGDVIKTFGSGTKQLKKLLIDEKVPVFLRDSLPILCADDQILWIPGVLRGSAYPVKDGSGFELTFTP